MKTMILAAFTFVSLGVGAANAEAAYHTPPHNFYQNNWMSGS
ncbi:MAG: hypothetical protein QOH05_4770 [Acetobacteraceae bacterium]|jgi:hypothetical protein|nr:hypothetical protein [Acetobacteraceae bacterium]